MRPPGGTHAGEAAAADLADRFAGRLEFGTAGLRGAMGAGPNRMNRAVVRAATAGLARWLHEHQPPGTGSGPRLGRPASFGGVRRRGRGRAHRGGHPRAPAARPQPHAPAGVRDPASVHRGRRDDHGEPQPARGQRLQALPGRRRADHPARGHRDRGRDPQPGPAAADPAGARRRPADHQARGRDRPGLPGRDPGRLPRCTASGRPRAGRARGLHVAARGGGPVDAAGHRAGRVPGAVRGARAGRAGPGLPDGVLPQPGGTRGARPRAGRRPRTGGRPGAGQ